MKMENTNVNCVGVDSKNKYKSHFTLKMNIDSTQMVSLGVEYVD